MGLCYHTGQWSDRLLARYTAGSRAMTKLVKNGTQKTPQYQKFADDIHARLYLRNEPTETGKGPSWAKDIHATVPDLPDWQRLKQRCRASSLAAGIATESILRATYDRVPTTDKKGKEKQSGAKQGQDENQSRQDMRQAIAEAEAEIDRAEDETGPLAEALGINAGTDPTAPPTGQDEEALLELWSMIRDNPELKEIADIAGRFKRMAKAASKQTVKRHVGEIIGLSTGEPLILPQELAGLRSNRYTRLRTLDRLINRKALGYKTRPVKETKAKGPFIVLLDVSGSMGYVTLVRAKAVALALMMRAREEKRSFGIATFNAAIQTTAHYIAGHAPDVNAFIDVLCQVSYGGTSFDEAYGFAMQAIAQDPTRYHAADIVLITDGEDSIEPYTREDLLKQRETVGTNYYGVVIGANGKALMSPANGFEGVQTEVWEMSHGELDNAGQILSPLINP